VSAFFGILRHDDAPVTRDQLQTMATPILDRGPDGQAFHTEGPLGLGFVRLQTTPEPEPLTVEQQDGHIVVAAARLDNRDELTSRLDLPPFTCDSDIIRRAHQQWGDRAPEHFLGAFAYAAWDAEKHRLTIVRDHIGVKPVFLVQTPAFSAFASDPRSLLRLPGVPRELDKTGVFYFFFPELQFYDMESTCFTAIKRLPPAHRLTIPRQGQARSERYWALDRDRELALASDEESTEAFLERFTVAVGRRVRCSGPVGSTLSGGLDSSSIACVAADILRRQGQPPLHTFSAEFPDSPTADESSFSRAVAEKAQVTAHRIYPGQVSPLADLPQVLSAVTHPFYAPNFFIPSGVCRAAKQEGIRVMLDGTDGDTTVGHGIDLFPETARRHDWKLFATEAEAVSRRFANRSFASPSGITFSHGLPELQALVRKGRLFEVARGVQMLGKTLGLSRKSLLMAALTGLSGRKNIRPPSRDVSHLNPHFVAQADGPRLLEEFTDRMLASFEGRRASQYNVLTTGGLPYALETFDRIGATNQVEYRYPFCDKELIEFCLAMPITLQLRNGWSRWILRSAMDRYLPEQVGWRGGKGDLSSIFDRGLKEFEEERLAQLARKAPASLLEFVRQGALHQAYAAYQDKGTVQSRRLLWRASLVVAWREIIDV
jgi:asparagine synthase (glutamine-hydrolysing)